MSEETITVPEHYKLFAKELKPLIKEIQDAFINKPISAGYPHSDINVFLDWFDPLQKAMKNLTSEINELSYMVLPKDKTISPDEVACSMQPLSTAIKEVIRIFHDIWKRPFVNEISKGQILFSAIPESILRQCLPAFEKVISVVENPEEMFKKHGTQIFHIEIVFGSEEAERFSEWIDELKRSGKQTAVIEKAHEKRYTFTGLAAAFLLGWWIGDWD